MVLPSGAVCFRVEGEGGGGGDTTKGFLAGLTSAPANRPAFAGNNGSPSADDDMRFTVKPALSDSVPTSLDRRGDLCVGETLATSVTDTADASRTNIQSVHPSVTRQRSNTIGPIDAAPTSTNRPLSELFQTSIDDCKPLLPFADRSAPLASIDGDDDYDAKPINDADSLLNNGVSDRRRHVLPEVEATYSKAGSVITDDTNTATTFDGAVPLADRGRKFAGRHTRRLVFKDGNCNISSRNVMERKRKYLVDIFTTLVDMRWRYNLLMFMAAFALSWLSFAVIWYLIALTHGDTEHPDHDEDGWIPCSAHVYDFPTALLFSIETQSTIGYGYRVINPVCVPSFFVLTIQTCFGVIIQSLMTGLIFAKLSRPKQRAHTIMFSQNAVICKRDLEYCLLFRVGDMRKSHIIGTSIRALMVKDRHTKEGEVIPLCQYPLELQTETCNSTDNFVFLVWPVTVVHKINSTSPLWDTSAEQMLTERFEIIVILEGIVESTGMTTQVRTSYLPGEILWGQRLAPLLTYQKDNGQYRIDYTRFHRAEPIAMPECSARKLAESGRSVGNGEESDHFPVHFTSPAVREATDGLRQKGIRRFRDSFTRRRTRSRRNASTNAIFENGNGADVAAGNPERSTNAVSEMLDETVADSNVKIGQLHQNDDQTNNNVRSRSSLYI